MTRPTSQVVRQVKTRCHRCGVFVRPSADHSCAGPDERFWKNVKKTDTCWFYKGMVDHTGYGRFFINKGYVAAHRWSYEALVGAIPAGLQIDHLCRTRTCVNPSHLEPVSQRENILRGNSIAAHNALKTVCLRGHPLTPDNLVRGQLANYGKRKCRECTNARWRRRHHGEKKP